MGARALAGTEQAEGMCLHCRALTETCFIPKSSHAVISGCLVAGHPITKYNYKLLLLPPDKVFTCYIRKNINILVYISPDLTCTNII